VVFPDPNGPTRATQRGPLPPFFSFEPAGDEQRQGFLPGANTPFTFAPNSAGLFNLQHNFWGNQMGARARYQASVGFTIELQCPLVLELHEGDKAEGVTLRKEIRFGIMKSVQIFQGQINSAAFGIFLDITHDVREL
jgi:hypothetical protein